LMTSIKHALSNSTDVSPIASTNKSMYSIRVECKYHKKAV
jgi:hypothetical protein